MLCLISLFNPRLNRYNWSASDISFSSGINVVLNSSQYPDTLFLCFILWSFALAVSFADTGTNFLMNLVLNAFQEVNMLLLLLFVTCIPGPCCVSASCCILSCLHHDAAV